MNRVARITLALLACIILLAQPHPAAAKPSLDAVMSAIHDLSQSDFIELVEWARSGAPGPAHRVTQLDWVESDIDGLSDSDKRNVRSMLANGQIAYSGTPSPTPSPTPQTWRDIPFTATSLVENPTEGDIQMLDGNVQAQIDGRSITACVSFKNVSQKTATEVFFEFPLADADGKTLGALPLDRKGTFSPNIGIYSKHGSENCVSRDLAAASLPILNAQSASFHVVKVIYSDGSMWVSSKK